MSACRVTVLAVSVISFLPAAAAAQSVEDRVKDLEKRLERIEQLLQKPGSPLPAAPTRQTSVVVASKSYSWIANPKSGDIIRIDKYTGSTSTVSSGRPCSWTVIDAKGYAWMFGGNGNGIRVDKDTGSSSNVVSSKAGEWEVVAGEEGKGDYVFVLNRGTGEVIRLDRSTGSNTTVISGK